MSRCTLTMEILLFFLPKDLKDTVPIKSYSILKKMHSHLFYRSSLDSYFYEFPDWDANEEPCVSYFRLASRRNGGELQNGRGCVGNSRAGI